MEISLKESKVRKASEMRARSFRLSPEGGATAGGDGSGSVRLGSARGHSNFVKRSNWLVGCNGDRTGDGQLNHDVGFRESVISNVLGIDL